MNEPRCKSCGKPFVEHLGVQSLCRENWKLKNSYEGLQAENEALSNALSSLSNELTDTIEDFERYKKKTEKLKKDLFALLQCGSNGRVVEEVEKLVEKCTCHERDSSYTCPKCHKEGYFGHMETYLAEQWAKDNPDKEMFIM